jgi:hypothetical protein
MDWSPAEWWFVWIYPSLRGNGPEAGVQTVVYAGIAMAVYPPLRKWAQRETAHLHAKVDHLVKHLPEVPAFDDRKHGFEPKAPSEPK